MYEVLDIYIINLYKNIIFNKLHNNIKNIYRIMIVWFWDMA
jgi:hypothetical protein